MSTNAPPQPPITPADMEFVPPAVRRMAAEAEALQARLYPAGGPTPPGNPADPTPPAPQPPAPQPASPQPAAPPPPPALAATPAPVAPQPATPQPPAPPPQPPELTQAEIDALLAQPSDGNPALARLQHAYKSQAGRLRAANERLSRAAAAPAAPMPAPTLLTAPADVADLQLPEDIVNTYGAELIDVISTVATHAAAQARADVLKQVAPALQSVANTTAASRQSDAIRYVDQALAPFGRTFENVDSDADFVSWLELTDQYTGVKRANVFLDAWRKGDGSRIAAWMTAYLKEVGYTAAPAPTPTPAAGTPPVPAARPTVPLETFAAPGRGPNPAATPTQPAPVETISRKQISVYYANKRRGMFRGKEQEMIDTEREIDLAVAEGRVTD